MKWNYIQAEGKYTLNEVIKIDSLFINKAVSCKIESQIGLKYHNKK